jgi:hypothetical protein
LSVGDEFQQDFRAIGDASSSDNGSSTPSFYSVDFHEVSNKLFNDLEDRLNAPHQADSNALFWLQFMLHTV